MCKILFPSVALINKLIIIDISINFDNGRGYIGEIDPANLPNGFGKEYYPSGKILYKGNIYFCFLNKETPNSSHFGIFPYYKSFKIEMKNITRYSQTLKEK